MSKSEPSEAELLSVFGPDPQQKHIHDRLRLAGWRGDLVEIEQFHDSVGGTIGLTSPGGSTLGIQFKTATEEGNVRVEPADLEQLDEALDLVVRWRDRLSADTWEDFLDEVARLRAPAFIPRKRKPDESFRLRTRKQIEPDL